MKFVIRFVSLSLSLLFALQLYAQKQDSVVGVVSLPLREKPSFLSRQTGILKYGQSVRILRERKNWFLISRGRSKGWVLSSSLGERDSILKDLKRSSAESSATYKDEVATAGKGFSPEYESMLKQKDKNLNFEAVDQVVQFWVPMKTLFKFQTEGGLQSEVLR